jgi:chromatin segregation and condensation protein Rec8/ScpA/Scc1 (kleisin family)
VVIGTGPAGLAALAARVIGRRREPDLDHLDLDLPSVAMAIEDVRHRVAAGVDTDFDAITAHCKRSVEVVAYFLAILELARWGLVRASQDHLDAAIRISRIEAPSGEALVSEWEG